MGDTPWATCGLSLDTLEKSFGVVRCALLWLRPSLYDRNQIRILCVYTMFFAFRFGPRDCMSGDWIPHVPSGL